MEEQPDAPQQPSPPFDEPVAELPKDVTNIAMLAHLLGVFTGFIGPLIIWVIKKDDHEFINDQCKEALNFQLALMIAYAVTGMIAIISCGLLFFVPMAPWILGLVFGITATVAASKGEAYQYPVTIRFLK